MFLQFLLKKDKVELNNEERCWNFNERGKESNSLF